MAKKKYVCAIAANARPECLALWAARGREDDREEVQQEGFARHMGAFGRFLEAASFSQGSVLNMAAVARECAVSAKVAEGYFGVLEDLLIAVRISRKPGRASSMPVLVGGTNAAST